MTHAQLVNSLAEHLRRRGPPPWIVATELTLGPNWSAREHPGIADVFAVRVSWSQRVSAVYEVKASREDLNGDMKSAKWHKYLKHCTHFYFAFPKGMVARKELEDLPKFVGIMLYNENKDIWRCQRQAMIHEPKLAVGADVYMAALFNLRQDTDATRERARRIAAKRAVLKEEGRILAMEYDRRGQKLAAQALRLKKEVEELRNLRSLQAGSAESSLNRLREALAQAGLPSDIWSVRKWAQEGGQEFPRSIDRIPKMLRHLADMVDASVKVKDTTELSKRERGVET